VIAIASWKLEHVDVLIPAQARVRLVREMGKLIAPVVRDLGINEGTRDSWVSLDRRGRVTGRWARMSGRSRRRCLLPCQPVPVSAWSGYR
jgi:hypothetical protein